MSGVYTNVSINTLTTYRLRYSLRYAVNHNSIMSPLLRQAVCVYFCVIRPKIKVDRYKGELLQFREK